jgi:plastocyanin
MKWMWVALLCVVWLTVSAAYAASFDISQMGRKFHPDTIEISVGDTLLIHNDDEFIHHIYVKSDDFNFDSTEQSPGETIPLKFTHAGEYVVRCEIHPKMQLTVTVKDAPR